MATNTLMKGIESKGSKPSVTDNFGLNKFAELARLAMTMNLLNSITVVINQDNFM